MKKFAILLTVLCILCPISSAKEKREIPYSKNQVELNLDDEPNIFEKRKLEQSEIRTNENSLNLNYTTDIRQKNLETMLYKDVSRLQPEKQSFSKTIDKNITNTTNVGATYSTKEKNGEMDDNVSVFTKYEKDKFAFTSAYSQSKDGYKQNGAGNGTVSLAPEIEINKHLSVKNVNSQNMSTNQAKSEVVMTLKPFKDDRLDLDVGAGQSFATDNQPAKSQVNSAIKFRF